MGLYLPTLDYPLVFDDILYLSNNPLITHPESFSRMGDLVEFVAWCRQLGAEPDLATNFILRPFAYLTFQWNHHFGGFDPRGYRMVNIVLHAANVVLIQALLWRLLTLASRRLRLPQGSEWFIPITAAALFAVHPYATESVTYVVQRFTSMAAFFFLLTLWLHFQAGAVQSGKVRALLRVGSAVAVLLGMLTKECTVMAPLMAVLLEWAVLGTSLRAALRRSFLLLLCLPVIPTLVVLTAAAHKGGVLSLHDALNLTNSLDAPISHWHYTLTQLTVVMHYLGHMIWPVSQNLDPQWPLHRSLFEGPVLVALGAVLLLLAAACWLIRRGSDDVRFRCAGTFILWYFTTIIVSSGLVPLPDLMAEHRAYVPSIGFFAALACVADLVRTQFRITAWADRLVPAALACIVLALGTATAMRNNVWRSAVSLWEDSAAKSPDKFRVWNNLGAAYAEIDRPTDAERCFRRALEIEPSFATAAVNLAVLLNRRNDFQDCLKVCQELLNHNPETGRNILFQHCVGVAFLGSGRVQDGLQLLQSIVTSKPDYRPSHVILGLAYSQLNRPADALKHWQIADSIQPAEPDLVALMEQVQQKLNLAGY